MPLRIASPAVSEHDVDITASLFQNEYLEATEQEQDTQTTVRKDKSANAIVNLEDSDSDDAALIAGSLAAANRKSSNLKGKSVQKGGGFQSMGLNAKLLQAITRKGFKVPTPVQRKTIPMVLDGQDVVGMARTGSGKTAAFVIPMIEKLKSHSAKVGARALVLSPSRELALQTLKVVKELARGTDLKCVLVVGGETLEDQFTAMASNPDIVIGTPGRFMHLKVECQLDLASIGYIVFDEADRLFELGFAAQLTEILHALPQSRQTLLFSATLPKSLVEFARAGLQEPTLVRLDAESKISPDLQSAFFTVKSAEKEGALLQILNDIARIPTGDPKPASHPITEIETKGKKRKREEPDVTEQQKGPSEHATIVFTATKHHVEYIATLLRQCGFAVSHAYGSMDQAARNMQVENFRTGQTTLLVVTDVAARGIDIPILANVVNYDFPAQPKMHIHRVGRTARAGHRGWSYSLVKASDAPYLLDLQLFLGFRLLVGSQDVSRPNYAEDIVLGSLSRDRLGANCEWVGKLLDEDSDLQALRSVAVKGEKLYLRTRKAASTESVRRGKEIATSKGWPQLHLLFGDDVNQEETERASMLARLSGYRPTETVFELGKRGQRDEAVDVIRRRRTRLDGQKANAKGGQESDSLSDDERPIPPRKDGISEDPAPDSSIDVNMDSASEDDLQVTFSKSENDEYDRKPTNGTFQSEYFMSYTPINSNLAEDRAYGVHSGSSTNHNPNSFFAAAQDATMDLAADEGGGIAEPSRHKKWDKKAKKYVYPADKDSKGGKGADGVGKRFIRSESGQKIAASFRTGRFDAWKKANKVAKMPRVGDSETSLPRHVANGHAFGGGKRFKYNSQKAPKEADKYRDDYHKKRKKMEKAKEERKDVFGQGKKELRGVDAVRKVRREKEKKREKTGGGKKGKGRY